MWLDACTENDVLSKGFEMKDILYLIGALIIIGWAAQVILCSDSQPILPEDEVDSLTEDQREE